MNELATLFILSVLAQYSTERLKFLIPDKAKSVAVPFLSLVICLILTVSCQIDLLLLFHIAEIEPLIGQVLTGIAISGGSVALNEIIKVLNGLKEGLQSVGG